MDFWGLHAIYEASSNSRVHPSRVLVLQSIPSSQATSPKALIKSKEKNTLDQKHPKAHHVSLKTSKNHHMDGYTLTKQKDLPPANIFISFPLTVSCFESATSRPGTIPVQPVAIFRNPKQSPGIYIYI